MSRSKLLSHRGHRAAVEGIVVAVPTALTMTYDVQFEDERASALFSRQTEPVTSTIPNAGLSCALRRITLHFWTP